VIQSDAELWCNDHGGHLVSYESLEEQKAVEGYFIDGGGRARPWRCSLPPGMRASSAGGAAERLCHACEPLTMPAFTPPQAA
jgi:hypothetical protein